MAFAWYFSPNNTYIWWICRCFVITFSLFDTLIASLMFNTCCVWLCIASRWLIAFNILDIARTCFQSGYLILIIRLSTLAMVSYRRVLILLKFVSIKVLNLSALQHLQSVTWAIKGTTCWFLTKFLLNVHKPDTRFCYALKYSHL